MPPTHQHRPAGHTHRTTKRPRAVIAVKAKALTCQAVKVGGINVGIAVRANGVCALIIGKQENDVRQLVSICIEADGYNQGDGEDGLFHKDRLDRDCIALSSMA